jgi:hypothetical protein
MTYPNRKKLTEYPIVTPTLADSAVNIQGNTVKRSTLQSILNLFIANSPVPTLSYKIFTVLITQSNGMGTSFIDTGLLTVGVSYKIDNNSLGMDFTNVGAPDNNINTYFIATGTTPNSWGAGEGTSNTLRYNTNAPVCVILENTIGNVWFTYDGIGVYSLNSNSLFTYTKTAWFSQSLPVNSINAKMLLNRNNTNQIEIVTFLNTTATDNILLNPAPIEIRIYN